MAARKTTKKATSRKAPTRKAPQTVDDLREEIEAQDPVDPKIVQARQEREDQILKSVAELEVDKSLQTLATAGLDVTNALSKVTAELQEKVTDLSNVNNAIEIKKRELERLHGVDIVASALDDLVARFDKKQKELEETIEEEKAQWEAADQERAERIALEDKKMSEERAREKEQYDYSLAQARKKDNDAFEEQKRLRAIAERDRQEALEKSWAQRQEALEAREQKIAEAQKKLEEDQAALSKKLDEEIGKVTNRLKRDFQTEKTIAEKDATSQLKLSEVQIQNLQQSLNDSKEIIKSLERKAEEAEKRAQEVATAAINSVSGREALEQVQKAQASQQQSGGKR